MGKKELPHYKKKQSVIYSRDTKPAELVQLGERFFSEGWLSDALDCFERAKSAESLEKMRKVCIEEGDVFLFRKTLRALEAEAGPAEWKELGDNARGLGKLQFAREAYRMAGERKALDEVDELIRPAQQADQDDEGQSDGEQPGADG